MMEIDPKENSDSNEEESPGEVSEKDVDQDSNSALESSEDVGEKKKRRYKKGIVYISFIPPFMSISKMSQLMSQYGKLGRIYLQPAEPNDG